MKLTAECCQFVEIGICEHLHVLSDLDLFCSLSMTRTLKTFAYLDKTPSVSFLCSVRRMKRDAVEIRVGIFLAYFDGPDGRVENKTKFHS